VTPGCPKPNPCEQGKSVDWIAVSGSMEFATNDAILHEMILHHRPLRTHLNRGASATLVLPTRSARLMSAKHERFERDNQCLETKKQGMYKA
jgi:hypothetical protein